MNKEQRNFRWAYAAILALAKRNLADANEKVKGTRNWPGGQEWHELCGSSHAVFLRAAREEAGIPHAEFLEGVRAADYDVSDLYDKELLNNVI
jgi:hypothetical protein